MSTIDPRFDPRFQRGFTGEGSASADAAAAHLRAQDAAPAAARRSRIHDPLAPPAEPRDFAESAHFAREPMADHELSDLLRTLDEDQDENDDDVRYEAKVVQGDSGGNSGGGAGGAEALDVADGQDDDEEHELRPRRNPWLLALWVASVALIVLPAVAFWQLQSQQYGVGWSGDQPPAGYVVSQLVAMLAPTSAIVGSLGIIVALCVHAFTWSGSEHDKTQRGQLND